jgi:hypothetical protein
MEERQVEIYIRKYLQVKGWDIKRDVKSIGQHGVDIYASHEKWRKTLWIEVKGGSGKHPHQEKHSAFYMLLGQCISRMDKEGNDPNKARIYAIGIPYEWADVFKNKIKKMKFGWKLLKLRTFLVKKNKTVLEKPYSFFLTEKAENGTVPKNGQDKMGK